MLKSLAKSNDYLDENVNNKLILTLGIVAVISPLLHVCWVVYQIVEDVFVTFLLYLFGSFIAILALWALQWGNSKPLLKYKIMASIVFAILTALYDFSVGIRASNSERTIQGTRDNGAQVFAWIYVFSMNTSGCAAVIIIAIYAYLLFKKDKTSDADNQLLAINTKYKEDILNSLFIPDIQSSEDQLQGYCSQMRDFFWPKIDDRMLAQIKEKKIKIYYPALLYGSVFLSLLGILFLFQMMWTLHKAINQGINNINDFRNQIEDQHNLNPRLKDYLLSLFNDFDHLFMGLDYGLVYGNIVGLILSIYAFILLFHVHKYKMLSLLFNKDGMKTRLFNECNCIIYHVSNSTRYISGIVSYLITGYLFITIIFSIIIALFASGWVTEFMKTSWRWILGYVAYFTLWYFIVQYLIEKRFLTNSDGSIKPHRLNWFNMFLLLNNFAYLPIGILLGIYRIIFWLLFLLFSFLRPDINMYPYNLRDWDVAHLNYYSFLRLMFLRMEYNPILRNSNDNNGLNMTNYTHFSDE